MTIAFYVQLHELAGLLGAAQVTIHTLVDDDTSQTQEILLRIYKIWKRQKMLTDARERAAFDLMMQHYLDNLKTYPEFSI